MRPAMYALLRAQWKRDNPPLRPDQPFVVVVVSPELKDIEAQIKSIRQEGK